MAKKSEVAEQLRLTFSDKDQFETAIIATYEIGRLVNELAWSARWLILGSSMDQHRQQCSDVSTRLIRPIILAFIPNDTLQLEMLLERVAEDLTTISMSEHFHEEASSALADYEDSFDADAFLPPLQQI